MQIKQNGTFIEKRKYKLKTYEMVELADNNGKTYTSRDLYYQRDKGFTDNEGVIWGAGAYCDCDDGLNTFIHEDGWVEITQEYTLEELYAVVGHKFVLRSSS